MESETISPVSAPNKMLTMRSLYNSVASLRGPSKHISTKMRKCHHSHILVTVGGLSPSKFTLKPVQEDIQIDFPLTMDRQTPEEFKREVLKEVEDVKINVNGFMMKQIDKNLTQAYCTTKKFDNKNHLGKHSRASIMRNLTSDTFKESTKSVNKAKFDEDECIVDEKAFMKTITSHYLNKIKD